VRQLIAANSAGSNAISAVSRRSGTVTANTLRSSLPEGVRECTAGGYSGGRCHGEWTDYRARRQRQRATVSGISQLHFPRSRSDVAQQLACSASLSKSNADSHPLTAQQIAALMPIGDGYLWRRQKLRPHQSSARTQSTVIALASRLTRNGAMNTAQIRHLWR